MSIEDRVNFCFARTLAGWRLPDNSAEMRDIDAYDVAAYITSLPRTDLPGKELDYPATSAPPDVPYRTAGHVPTRIVAVYHVSDPTRRRSPVREREKALTNYNFVIRQA